MHFYLLFRSLTVTEESSLQRGLTLCDVGGGKK